jgi:hypothetical protein
VVSAPLELWNSVACVPSTAARWVRCQDTQAGFWHNAGHGRFAKWLLGGSRGGPAQEVPRRETRLWSLCPVLFSLLDSNCIATNSAIIEVLHRSFRFSGSWHFNKPEAFGQTTCLINGDSAELHRAKLLKQLAQLFLCGRTIQITYQQLHIFTRSRRLIAKKNRTPQRPQLGRSELRTRCPRRRVPSRSRTLAAGVPNSALALSPQPSLRIELGKPFSMDRDRAVAIA